MGPRNYIVINEAPRLNPIRTADINRAFAENPPGKVLVVTATPLWRCRVTRATRWRRPRD